MTDGLLAALLLKKFLKCSSGSQARLFGKNSTCNDGNKLLFSLPTRDRPPVVSALQESHLQKLRELFSKLGDEQLGFPPKRLKPCAHKICYRNNDLSLHIEIETSGDNTFTNSSKHNSWHQMQEILKLNSEYCRLQN